MQSNMLATQWETEGRGRGGGAPEPPDKVFSVSIRTSPPVTVKPTNVCVAYPTVPTPHHMETLTKSVNRGWFMGCWLTKSAAYLTLGVMYPP